MVCTDLQKFEALVAAIDDATETFDIWLACQTSHSDRETVDTLNTLYPGVLPWIEQALLANFVNILYLMNETRADTLNFKSLLKHLSSTTSDISVKELTERISALKPIWKKIAILRNEVFAHRADVAAGLDPFKKANLSHQEVKSLIRDCQFIAARFGLIRFGTHYHFNSGTGETMKKLLSGGCQDFCVRALR